MCGIACAETRADPLSDAPAGAHAEVPAALLEAIPKPSDKIKEIKSCKLCLLKGIFL